MITLELFRRKFLPIVIMMGLSSVFADEIYDCQVMIIVRKDEVQERSSIENFRLKEERSSRHALTLAGKTQIVLELDIENIDSDILSHDTQYHNNKWDITYRKDLGQYTESIHFNFDKKSGKVMYKATGLNSSASASGKCIRNLRFQKQINS